MIFPIRRVLLTFVAIAGPAAHRGVAQDVQPAMIVVRTAPEPIHAGKFQPTWPSLQQYEAPEWFRDAKFGIWAHWGPQCAPETGDWYARNLYIEGHRQNRLHVERFGHPSRFGFKDVIHQWKAEQWDPGKLVALYKRAGAQYFVAMANHCDNFDLWDSKYQPWNSVSVGPKKDIVGGWAKAARDNGLRFGVSVHAAHAWIWFESAQGSDKHGPLAGAAYDGQLTLADGKGKWWEGLDPQDLYAQNHAPSLDFTNPSKINSQWNWGNGASLPDQEYCQKFYNRAIDLVNKHQPDLIYFDDTALPLWPVSDAGLKIAAHYYNSNMANHGGALEAVLFGKILDPQQRQCMVWDIERGTTNQIEPLPFQTDTCLGDWHYNRSRFEQHRYKSAKTVIQTLVDVVSKNGNLLLSVPVRGEGTIDDDELAVIEQIAAWMDVNREAIFGTRPWKICGEGPALQNAAPIQAQGFNEGKGQPLTADDVRFTTKEDTLYAIALGRPANGRVVIQSLGTDAKLLDKKIVDVRELGSANAVRWFQEGDGLTIWLPAAAGADENAMPIVCRIRLGP